MALKTKMAALKAAAAGGFVSIMPVMTIA